MLIASMNWTATIASLAIVAFVIGANLVKLLVDEVPLRAAVVRMSIISIVALAFLAASALLARL